MGYLVQRRGRLSFSAFLLLSMPVFTFLVVVSTYIMIQPAGAMGRFLFPALPAFALLLVGGLSRFLPQRLSWTASLVVTAGMVVLAIYALVGVLTPAFGRPRPLTGAEIQSVPNPVNVEFGTLGSGQGSLARLLGYQITPATIKPGGTVEVTVYWQALTRTDQNYVIFVHFLSDEGPMIAQYDTHPGLGRYPTSAWEPDVAFADTYRLHLSETAYAPDTGYVQVGVYLPGGLRLAMPDGETALRLGAVEVRPLPGEIPNVMDFSFDAQVALVGYDLDRRLARPGETIRVMLYWKALTSLETDYGMFAHILGSGDQTWGSHDGQPFDDPTSRWQPGQIVEDVRYLTVGETTPPDFYDIEVGVYVPGGDRLPIVAEDGHWLSNRLLLGKIRVVDG
jgi:hypothetical protein